MLRPSLCVDLLLLISFTQGKSSQICARHALGNEEKGETSPIVYMNLYDLALLPLPAFFPLAPKRWEGGGKSFP